MKPKRTRTELRLPEPLYEVLRQKAFDGKISLNQLMVDQLSEANRNELNGGGKKEGK